VLRLFRRNWLGRTSWTREGGGFRVPVTAGGPEPFLMVDEEDRVYAGFSDGGIRSWNMKDERDDLKPVLLGGAERARVAALYLQQMGKAWPAEAEGR
jgi:hypothetical protein